MATTAITSEQFVSAIAAEVASGVEAAVECWMAQVERALKDTQLTTLGRVYAVKAIIEKYKRLTGKEHLLGRRT